MKLKILILAFLTLFLNNACKQDDFAEIQTENKELQGDALIKSKHSPLGLGRGYDVTGEYADHSALRSPIIQLDGILGALYAHKNVDGGIATNTKTESIFYASDAENFSKQVTESTNLSAGLTLKFPVFRASITSSFSNSLNVENKINSKHVYSEYNVIVARKTLRFKNSDTRLLKKHLTRSFINAVKYSSPQAIVQSYGTHLVLSLTAGAKATIRFKSETNTTTETTERETIAKVGATVNAFRFLNIKTGYTNTQADLDLYEKEKKDIRLYFKTAGGDSALRLNEGVESEYGLIEEFKNYYDWLPTASNPKNFQLVGLNNTSFVPIYELVDNPTKKADLKAYIEKYLTDNGVNLFYELPVPVPMYRYSSYDYGDYDEFFTPINIHNDYYTNEGIVFNVIGSQVHNKNAKPVYRFSTTGSSYFFSLNPQAPQRFTREDVSFYAFDYKIEGTVPVYNHQFIGGENSSFRLSIKSDEGSGFNNRGVAFYAYPPSSARSAKKL